MTEDQFIPFIHNYCNRWCERCRFITRCRVGVEEIKRMENDKELAFDDIAEIVSNNLKKALDFLHQFAEEHGIDMEAISQEVRETDLKRPEFTPEQLQLKTWSRDYIKIVTDWFDQHQEDFQDKENELNQKLQMGVRGVTRSAAELSNALDSIKWFLYFISVKMQRAFSGLHNDWGEDDENPIQTDANGTAKVALDAIDQSLAAWEVVRAHFPDETDNLIDIFLLLGRMRKGLTEIFPNAQDFIRPGFDEPALYNV